MTDGTEGPGEADFDFLLGSLPDGRIILDFRGMKIDHLKLTQDRAAELRDGLDEAIKDARQGVLINLDRMN